MNNWIEILGKVINLSHYTTLTLRQREDQQWILDIQGTHPKIDNPTNLSNRSFYNRKVHAEKAQQLQEQLIQIPKSFDNWYLVKHLPFLKLVNLTHCVGLDMCSFKGKSQVYINFFKNSLVYSINKIGRAHV